MVSRNIISALIITTALGFGCSETTEMPRELLGSEYYPLRIGDYRIYQVSGTEYFNAADSVIFEYQLKETVIDSFQNLENGISYTLLREKKYALESNWESDSVWTARKDSYKAVLTENNVPKVVLTFPLEENKTWNSNVLNDLPDNDFEMVQVNKTYDELSVEYSSTVTVVQEELLDDPIVTYISKKEIYALDIGLIYKENNEYEYQQGIDTGKQKIKSGIIYHQYLLEYGTE